MANPPSTPPRSQESTSSVTVTNARTPKTPQYSFGASLLTPKSTRKSKSAANGSRHDVKTPVKNIQVVPFGPVTPELTPFKSPRRKRRVIDFSNETLSRNKVEDFHKFASSSLHILPAPSTVGSGRKAINFKQLNPPPQLDFSFMDQIAHEEDDDDNDDEDQLSLLLGNSSIQMLSNPMNYIPDSPTRRKPKLVRKVPPSTPRNQVIDDDTVKEWHHKSSNIHFLNEKDIPGVIQKVSLPNPFVLLASDEKEMKIPLLSTVDYSTHNEFFNKGTGKREIVKLSDEEARIKPKRLDFESI